MATTVEQETNEMIVKRVSVPIGLEELMQGLAKEVLLKKPSDLYVFASEYFTRLLEMKQSGSYKTKPVKVVQSVTKQSQKIPMDKFAIKKPMAKQLSRQLSIRGQSPPKSQKPQVKKDDRAKRMLETKRKARQAANIEEKENLKLALQKPTKSQQSTPREAPKESPRDNKTSRERSRGRAAKSDNKSSQNTPRDSSRSVPRPLTEGKSPRKLRESPKKGSTKDEKKISKVGEAAKFVPIVGGLATSLKDKVEQKNIKGESEEVKKEIAEQFTKDKISVGSAETKIEDKSINEEPCKDDTVKTEEKEVAPTNSKKSVDGTENKKITAEVEAVNKEDIDVLKEKIYEDPTEESKTKNGVNGETKTEVQELQSVDKKEDNKTEAALQLGYVEDASAEKIDEQSTKEDKAKAAGAKVESQELQNITVSGDTILKDAMKLDKTKEEIDSKETEKKQIPKEKEDMGLPKDVVDKQSANKGIITAERKVGEKLLAIEHKEDGNVEDAASKNEENESQLGKDKELYTISKEVDSNKPVGNSENVPIMKEIIEVNKETNENRTKENKSKEDHAVMKVERNLQGLKHEKEKGSIKIEETGANNEKNSEQHTENKHTSEESLLNEAGDEQSANKKNIKAESKGGEKEQELQAIERKENVDVEGVSAKNEEKEAKLGEDKELDETFKETDSNKPAGNSANISIMEEIKELNKGPKEKIDEITEENKTKENESKENHTVMKVKETLQELKIEEEKSNIKIEETDGKKKEEKGKQYPKNKQQIPKEKERKLIEKKQELQSVEHKEDINVEEVAAKNEEKETKLVDEKELDAILKEGDSDVGNRENISIMKQIKKVTKEPEEKIDEITIEDKTKENRSKEKIIHVGENVQELQEEDKSKIKTEEARSKNEEKDEHHTENKQIVEENKEVKKEVDEQVIAKEGASKELNVLLQNVEQKENNKVEETVTRNEEKHKKLDYSKESVGSSEDKQVTEEIKKEIKEVKDVSKENIDGQSIKEDNGETKVVENVHKLKDAEEKDNTKAEEAVEKTEEKHGKLGGDVKETDKTLDEEVIILPKEAIDGQSTREDKTTEEINTEIKVGKNVEDNENRNEKAAANIEAKDAKFGKVFAEKAITEETDIPNKEVKEMVNEQFTKGDVQELQGVEDSKEVVANNEEEKKEVHKILEGSDLKKSGSTENKNKNEDIDEANKEIKEKINKQSAEGNIIEEEMNVKDSDKIEDISAKKEEKEAKFGGVQEVGKNHKETVADSQQITEDHGKVNRKVDTETRVEQFTKDDKTKEDIKVETKVGESIQKPQNVEDITSKAEESKDKDTKVENVKETNTAHEENYSNISEEQSPKEKNKKSETKMNNNEENEEKDVKFGDVKQVDEIPSKTIDDSENIVKPSVEESKLEPEEKSKKIVVNGEKGITVEQNKNENCSNKNTFVENMEENDTLTKTIKDAKLDDKTKGPNVEEIHYMAFRNQENEGDKDIDVKKHIGLADEITNDVGANRMVKEIVNPIEESNIGNKKIDEDVKSRGHKIDKTINEASSVDEEIKVKAKSSPEIKSRASSIEDKAENKNKIITNKKTVEDRDKNELNDREKSEKNEESELKDKILHDNGELIMVNTEQEKQSKLKSESIEISKISGKVEQQDISKLLDENKEKNESKDVEDKKHEQRKDYIDKKMEKSSDIHQESKMKEQDNKDSKPDDGIEKKVGISAPADMKIDNKSHEPENNNRDKIIAEKTQGKNKIVSDDEEILEEKNRNIEGNASSLSIKDIQNNQVTNKEISKNAIVVNKDLEKIKEVGRQNNAAEEINDLKVLKTETDSQQNEANKLLPEIITKGEYEPKPLTIEEKATQKHDTTLESRKIGENLEQENKVKKPKAADIENLENNIKDISNESMDSETTTFIEDDGKNIEEIKAPIIESAKSIVTNIENVNKQQSSIEEHKSEIEESKTKDTEKPIIFKNKEVVVQEDGKESEIRVKRETENDNTKQVIVDSDKVEETSSYKNSNEPIIDKGHEIDQKTIIKDKETGENLSDQAELVQKQNDKESSKEKTGTVDRNADTTYDKTAETDGQKSEMKNQSLESPSQERGNAQEKRDASSTSLAKSEDEIVRDILLNAEKLDSGKKVYKKGTEEPVLPELQVEKQNVVESKNSLEKPNEESKREKKDLNISKIVEEELKLDETRGLSKENTFVVEEGKSKLKDKVENASKLFDIKAIKSVISSTMSLLKPGHIDPNVKTHLNDFLTQEKHNVFLEPILKSNEEKTESTAAMPVAEESKKNHENEELKERPNDQMENHEMLDEKVDKKESKIVEIDANKVNESKNEESKVTELDIVKREISNVGCAELTKPINDFLKNEKKHVFIYDESSKSKEDNNKELEETSDTTKQSFDSNSKESQKLKHHKSRSMTHSNISKIPSAEKMKLRDDKPLRRLNTADSIKKDKTEPKSRIPTAEKKRQKSKSEASVESPREEPKVAERKSAKGSRLEKNKSVSNIQDIDPTEKHSKKKIRSMTIDEHCQSVAIPHLSKIPHSSDSSNEDISSKLLLKPEFEREIKSAVEIFGQKSEDSSSAQDISNKELGTMLSEEESLHNDVEKQRNESEVPRVPGDDLKKEDSPEDQRNIESKTLDVGSSILEKQQKTEDIPVNTPDKDLEDDKTVIKSKPNGIIKDSSREENKKKQYFQEDNKSIKVDENDKIEHSKALIDAVIIIQKIWRGFKIRKHITKANIFGKSVHKEKNSDEKLKNVHDKSAVKIQSVWRGYQTRKRIGSEDNHMLSSIAEESADRFEDTQPKTRSAGSLRGKRSILKQHSIMVYSKENSPTENVENSVKLTEHDVTKALQKLADVPTDKPSFYRSQTVDEVPILKKEVTPLIDKEKDDNNNKQVEAKDYVKKDKEGCKDCEAKMTPTEKEVKDKIEEIMATDPKHQLSKEIKEEVARIIENNNNNNLPQHEPSQEERPQSIDSTDSAVTVIYNSKEDDHEPSNQQSRSELEALNHSIKKHEELIEQVRNKLQEERKTLSEEKNFKPQKRETVKEDNVTNSIKEHVELIDQAQNNLLDQISGNANSKFDIEKLRKDLEEAALIYKNDNEDAKVENDERDHLLEYLSDFEAEEEPDNARRDLPDILEEEEEKKNEEDKIAVKAEGKKFCGSCSEEPKVEKIVDGVALRDLVESIEPNINQGKKIQLKESSDTATGSSETSLEQDNVKIKKEAKKANIKPVESLQIKPKEDAATEETKLLAPEQAATSPPPKKPGASDLPNAVVVPIPTPNMLSSNNEDNTKVIVAISPQNGGERSSPQKQDTVVVSLSPPRQSSPPKHDVLNKEEMETRSVESGNQTSVQLTEASPAGDAPVTSPPPPTADAARKADPTRADRKNKSASAGDPSSSQRAERPAAKPGGSESAAEGESRAAMERKQGNSVEQAATKIQAGFRGYQVRKQLKLKNGSSDITTNTPISNKRSLRRKTSKDNKSKENKTPGPKNIEEQSAVKIQAGVRGFLVRRRQKKQKTEA